MRLSIILILSLFLFLTAMDSQAAPANDWTACSDDLTNWTDRTVVPVTGRIQRICLEMDNSHVGDEGFVVNSPTAKVCTSTDATNSAEGALTYDLRYCPGEADPAVNNCPIIVSNVTESGCIAVTRGRYMIDISAQPGAGEEAIVEVRNY